MHDFQPIVLVGGKSSRFGRDKLREPIPTNGGPARWLVDMPIGVLRAVFGPCVAVVGECDPAVAARADLVFPDRHPGRGPIGGIVAALQHSGRDIFVLAGDLPGINENDVRTILSQAAGSPLAAAVLARTDHPEPCIGIYRSASLPYLLAAMSASPMPPLHAAIPRDRLACVPIPQGSAANINRPSDMPCNLRP